ncbi:DUF982 domain-containing protein [Phyllobacterium sp. 0TCS1.6A]|jgi:hypothetical protein|uniref:DUF982 domain-containing protein n=1 Tax=unclassified Phyllobacterium TaxID=2638441 RepID=UPI003A5BA28C
MPNKGFQEVTLLTRQPGKMRVITTLEDAAEFILRDWPFDDASPELDAAKRALINSHEGKMSPGVARFALIEAAKVANIYVQPTGPSLAGGRPSPKWGKRKPTRSA